VAQFDTYITSRNVSVAVNPAGTPLVTPPGFPEGSPILSEIAAIGNLTGFDGAKPALFSRNYRFIGGDTQLLGNLEYRIPIFGPATLALFADVGSVFNLQKTGTQIINSEFLDDDRLIGPGRLTALSLINTPTLESAAGSILYYNNRVLTKTDFLNLFCGGNRLGCPSSLPSGIDQFFLRGEVQQNSLLRVDDAAFNGIGDFKASVGVELRVQVPIVNVPFRLIYFYNPNAKLGVTEELPGIFLPGKRSGFRFTVGRTF
jgi:outer membrane protein insertion porin family